MLEVNPNFKHGMQGKKHTESTIAAIKAKRAIQEVTPAMLQSLELGRTKVWTPEMREKMAIHAKQNGLGTNRGADSPAWRGGITPLKRSFRGCPRYAEWRETVMVRDNYTCLRCSAKGYLEVNHIKTVKDIFNEYKPDTMDDVYAIDILWDLSNGETLCAPCHRGVK